MFWTRCAFFLFAIWLAHCHSIGQQELLDQDDFILYGSYALPPPPPPLPEMQIGYPKENQVEARQQYQPNIFQTLNGLEPQDNHRPTEKFNYKIPNDITDLNDLISQEKLTDGGFIKGFLALDDMVSSKVHVQLHGDKLNTMRVKRDVPESKIIVPRLYQDPTPNSSHEVEDIMSVKRKYSNLEQDEWMHTNPHSSSFPSSMGQPYAYGREQSHHSNEHSSYQSAHHSGRDHSVYHEPYGNNWERQPNYGGHMGDGNNWERQPNYGGHMSGSYPNEFGGSRGYNQYQNHHMYKRSPNNGMTQHQHDEHHEHELEAQRKLQTEHDHEIHHQQEQQSQHQHDGHHQQAEQQSQYEEPPQTQQQHRSNNTQHDAQQLNAQEEKHDTQEQTDPEIIAEKTKVPTARNHLSQLMNQKENVVDEMLEKFLQTGKIPDWIPPVNTGGSKEAHSTLQRKQSETINAEKTIDMLDSIVKSIDMIDSIADREDDFPELEDPYEMSAEQSD